MIALLHFDSTSNSITVVTRGESEGGLQEVISQRLPRGPPPPYPGGFAQRIWQITLQGSELA